jgi:hypothetical protein
LKKALSLTDSVCVRSYKTYLYANKLYASMGQTTFRDDDVLHEEQPGNQAADVTIQRVYDERIDDTALSSVAIRKYSLGYIKTVISVRGEGCNCGNMPRNTNFAPSSKRIGSETDETAGKTAPVSSLQLYPNPGNGLVTIDLTSSLSGAIDITVFDLTGSAVRTIRQDITEGENTFQLKLTDLSKATYVVRISGSGNEFTRKIIIQ